MYPESQPPDPHDPVAMREACDNWWTVTTRSLRAGPRKFTLSDELKKFLVVTEALARSAEANGLDSEPLILFLRDAKLFYFKLQDRLPTAIDRVHVLVNRLKLKLDAQQHTPRSQAAPSPDTPQVPPEPPLVPDPGEARKRTDRRSTKVSL